MSIKYFMMVVVLFYVSPVVSEEDDVSDELKKIKQEASIIEEKKNIAEFKKTIAEAERDIKKAEDEKNKAGFPSGDTKPLAGEVASDDKFGYFSEILAYHSIQKSSKKVGSEIDSLDSLGVNGRILILENTDFVSGDVPVIQLMQQFDWYEKAFASQLEGNEELLAELTNGDKPLSIGGGGLTFLSGTISSLADIIGFFKTDYSIKGKEISIKNTALTATIAKEITKHEIYLPNFRKIKSSSLLTKFTSRIIDVTKLKKTLALMTVQIIKPSKMEIGNLTKLIEAAEKKLSKLKSPANDVAISKLKNRIIELKNEKSIFESQKFIAEKHFSETETIISEFTSFGELITMVKDGEKKSLIVSAVIRESIDNLNISHLLYLNVASSGGEAITVKKTFSSGHVAFLGGSVIVYILSDINGKIISSNSISSSSKFDFDLAEKDETEPFDIFEYED